MQILCVDDDIITIKIYENILLQNGFQKGEISLAKSANEALDLIHTYHFDIMITDLVMPDMSGLDLLKQTKEFSPNTEVIVATAFASIESAITAMKLGARDYITKPLDTTLVLEKVRNVCDYVNQKKEAEDYRYAMEMVETSASHDLSALEIKLYLYMQTVEGIQDILKSKDSPEEKVLYLNKLIENLNEDLNKNNA